MSKTPSHWQAARHHLHRNDPILRPILARFEAETLRSRQNPFETLARAITGQQISVKAAARIWERLEAALTPVTPQTVLRAEVLQLRSVGLSTQKVHYLKSLAEAFTLGELQGDAWLEEDDEAIIRRLTTVKGIGRWTAEMFLIFYLLRPDVLPLTDIGLQKGIEKLYNNGNKLTLAEMRSISEPWRPYRSVATWYLWRSLDPEPVEY